MNMEQSHETFNLFLKQTIIQWQNISWIFFVFCLNIEIFMHTLLDRFRIWAAELIEVKRNQSKKPTNKNRFSFQEFNIQLEICINVFFASTRYWSEAMERFFSKNPISFSLFFYLWIGCFWKTCEDRWLSKMNTTWLRVNYSCSHAVCPIEYCITQKKKTKTDYQLDEEVSHLNKYTI